MWAAVTCWDLVEIGNGVVVDTEADVVPMEDTDEGTHVRFRAIKIGAGALIGTRAIVQPGAYIGSHVRIAPGATVTGFVNRCDLLPP